MNNYLLVTGPYRSGTTLLDKLLNSHPHLGVASQVLQVLLFEVKKKFLEERDIEQRYPIGHLFLEKRYSLDDFSQYLITNYLSSDEVIKILEKSRNYSGTLNPEIINHYLNSELPKEGTFFQVFEQIFLSISSYFDDKNVTWLGTKEILSMEFVPALIASGVRIIQIIRDPRDVVASTIFGDSMGKALPLLYTLRMWRKQIALYCQYLNDNNFKSIRYEDLVYKPWFTLDKITTFLGVTNFNRTAFLNGIHDQTGDQWGGNSSYASYNSISSSSVGRYKEKLPPEIIRYIEAACYPEMKLMDYVFTQRPGDISTIDKEGLIGLDTEPGKKEGFPLDYSLNQDNLTAEIERLSKLEGEVSLETARLWFIFPEAYPMLKNAIMF